MKMVTVFIVILSIVMSLHCSELDQEAKTEDVNDDVQDLQYEESERSGYGYPMVNPAFNRPKPRPPPNPVALDISVCYACTDCPKVLNGTLSKYCPYTQDPTKQGRCVVYAEQYRHTKAPYYIRGCASERGSCLDIRKAHSTHTDVVKLLNCHECEGDRCNTNSASLSLIDTTMAFLAMVVSPLIAKYTLS